MTNPKEAFSIGTRVCHTTDKKCNEGVVVWKHGPETITRVPGRVWSVHWSNGQRGIYIPEDIRRIPPKNLKKIVEEQLTPEDISADEEKE